MSRGVKLLICKICCHVPCFCWATRWYQRGTYSRQRFKESRVMDSKWQGRLLLNTLSSPELSTCCDIFDIVWNCSNCQYIFLYIYIYRNTFLSMKMCVWISHWIYCILPVCQNFSRARNVSNPQCKNVCQKIPMNTNICLLMRMLEMGW